MTLYFNIGHTYVIQIVYRFLKWNFIIIINNLIIIINNHQPRVKSVFFSKILIHSHTISHKNSSRDSKYGQADSLWDLPCSRVRASGMWGSGCELTGGAQTFYWVSNCTVRKETASGSKALIHHHQTQSSLLLYSRIVLFLFSSLSTFS